MSLRAHLNWSVRRHRFVVWLMKRELRRDMSDPAVYSGMTIEDDDGLTYRFSVAKEDVTDDIFVAETNPSVTVDKDYPYVAHRSVHRSHDGARAALRQWADEHPEYDGAVDLDVCHHLVLP